MKATITKLAVAVALTAMLGVFTACDDGSGGGSSSNGGDDPGTVTDAPLAPTITTVSLPDGAMGIAYSQTLEATGDTPITWTIDSGALPTGLSLAADGTISGKPTAADTCAFTVKATNAVDSDTKALSITVGGIPYVVTPSGGSFTATGGTLETPFTPVAIQTVINAIRDDAAGKDCAITFVGNDGDPLNLGNSSTIGFTGDWGAITLLGSVTSGIGVSTQGTIYTTEGNINIESKAVIANTNGYNDNARAIYNGGTGTITVSGGTVSATIGWAIVNGDDGTIKVTGGTVTNTSNGRAIHNSSDGEVIVSGGTVSATTAGYAIFNYSDGTITVSGGTVINTGSGANRSTIYNNTGTVIVSGGTVSATVGTAITNNSGTGTVTVSGGVVFAYGSSRGYAVPTTFTREDDGLIIWWNNTGSPGPFTTGATTGLGSEPDTATVTWGTSGADSGIKYTNGANSGFIKVDGVTVTP